MREVVIVDAVRSPIGKRSGSLATTHPADVLGPVMQAVLERQGVAVVVGRPGRRWLHQQGRRAGHEHHANGVAVARRFGRRGVHDGRLTMRLVAVRRQPRPLADRFRGRGRRDGVRCREPESRPDRRRRRGGRCGWLRQAAVALVLRAVRVGDAVRGRGADRREVRHHPSDVRRVRIGLAGAGRRGRGGGSLRAPDRAARRRDPRCGWCPNGRDAAIRARRDPA